MLKPCAAIVIAFSLFVSILFNNAHGQCISTFPYNESFENSDGGWLVKGSLASWEWGTPAKPTINKAAGGSRCWVTGGLVNDYYNDGESSWLQSPCFDFSAVANPSVRVKLWWETENGYDGASLQFSTDNGASWANIGTAAGSASCNDSNWYNLPSVRFLGAFGSAGGWSGSIKPTSGSCVGGGGSGGWVTAFHALNGLGGKSNVLLRFTFGAGTQCNNFDGFAVDDISIFDTPPGTGEIVYSCVDSSTALFAVNSSTCPTVFSWHFNDPQSGAADSSNTANPQHSFSAPGTYTVLVTAGDNGTPAFTIRKAVTILGTSVSVTTPIACAGGATGAATVNVTASPDPLVFSWNSNPAQQTATASGLPAGTYAVTVSSKNACSTSATISLAGNPIIVAADVQQPGCLFTAGKISLTVSGGEAPFTYSWQPAVSTNNIAANLPNGSYTVVVKDNRACADSTNYTIAALPKPQASVTKISDVDCNGASYGAAAVFVAGGTAPFSFLWDNDTSKNSDVVKGLAAGNHFVEVTDKNGCRITSNVNIGISGICNEIYFPNSFSPNTDGRNDFFGPAGNVIDISNYSIKIFNRYGQLVFNSNNPLQKWDGTFKGKNLNTGAYVWQASYTYKGRIQRSRFGTITLIR